ncbi:high affinity cationic amino acid transporter 1-like [Babylonia areolata]|uniref:high affinity cationic amino acid transporter 1-like n=1 Tax=Babylonia areolata TaxID=304850 RepID=UPI003FD1890D
MAGCGRSLRKLFRKKEYTEEDLHRSELRRCLTTWELVGLGLSSTLGTGVYVMSGQVARQSAGPAVVLSFLVAGVTAALAGFCFAEFAARVPRAGSAYVYSYVTVGELMAFAIGWNILLEYIIGTASLGRALSSYVDSVSGNVILEAFRHHLPMAVPGLAAYPDFLALALVAVAVGIVAVGVKESVWVNTILSCINIFIIAIMIVCGFYKGDLHNWQLSGEELPESGAGDGGFTPFGFSGIMTGAATCFFAFVGFDFIASMGEEAMDSQRSVPVSMGVTVVIDLVLYCGMAAVVTLMVPYFAVDLNAPVTSAFDYVGWTVATYGVTLGAVCGMTSSLMGGAFPMARVVYAMSSDGLIFRCLSAVSPRFHTPFLGTVVTGGFTAMMALLLDLSALMDMMSIGTLLAFGLVAVCVLILRYENDKDPAENGVSGVKTSDETSSGFKVRHLISSRSSTPTPATAKIAKVSIAVMCISQVALAITVTTGYELLAGLSVWTVLLASVLSLTILACVFVISRQPQNPVHLKFRAPLVPVLPAFSCFANVYLMFKLSLVTWLRLIVWLALGFCIYFFYGVRHSSLNVDTEESPLLFASNDDMTNYTAPPPTHRSLHPDRAPLYSVPHKANQSTPRGPCQGSASYVVAPSHTPSTGQSTLQGPHPDSDCSVLRGAHPGNPDDSVDSGHVGHSL